MNLKNIYKKNFRKCLLLFVVAFSWASFSYGQVGCYALDFKNNTPSEEYVQVNAAPICPEDDENFTVAAWFNVDLTVDRRPIVSIINSFDGADAGTFVIRVNDDDLEVFTYHTDGMPADLVNFGGVITAGQWHHVAAVKVAGSIFVYLDGGLLNSVPMNFADDGECTANTVLIGRRRLEAPPNVDAFFQGAIDEVAIWNTNLSPGNIASLANQNPASNFPGGLQAYYDMEDGTGLVLSDQSGNAYNGELNNMEEDDWIENDLVVICPSANESVLCGESTDFGEPVVINCPQVQLVFGENIVEQPCSSNIIRIITKNWFHPDDPDGNPVCTQVINVMRIDNSLFECPDNLDDIESPSLSCDGNFATDDDGHPHPSVTGYPTIDGVVIHQDIDCDIVLFYTDQAVDLDCVNIKYIRTWTLMQDCPIDQNPGMVTCIQTIKVVDKDGPTIIDCPDDRTESTAPNSCVSGPIVLEDAIFNDNCSGVASTTTTVDGQPLIGNIIPPGLAIGDHEVVVYATDGCGNDSEECSYTITIEDQVNPVAVCDQLTISISTDPTWVSADVFDGGSEDNCGIVSIEVRRMDSPFCIGIDATLFGPTVPFYCCDVGHTVWVVLRVTDESDNTNTCMVEIPVDDKIDPIIVCPPPITIDCWESTHPDDTGWATATDNCGATVDYYDIDNLTNCNTGFITRIWTATDPFGNSTSCPQTISIQNLTPFTENDITWPPDVNETGCILPSATGEPEYSDGPCDLIAHVYEDVELPFANGCVLILRTWTVFDDCQSAPSNSDCPGGIMCWTWEQEISIMSTEDPQITCTPPDDFCSYDPDCETGSATLTVEATDDCQSLLYRYKIDLNNNGSIDIPWTDDLDGSVTDDFELGTHKIYWKVFDGCGNVAECNYLFTIKDCLAPILTTFHVVSSELDPGMEIVQWATDWVLANSTYDNCGPIVQFLVRVPSLGIGQIAPPGDAAPSYAFTCADLIAYAQPMEVDIWAMDASGNWTYNTTTIELQDNVDPTCSTPPSFAVSGGIENEEGTEVEYVDVEVAGDINDIAITGDDGTFGFNLPANSNYTVTPERDDNILNGVSTYDLVLISKHILQFELLTSPYKMIAADINHSGTISTLDLVALRRVVLFIDDEFPDNTSWRFVDAEFVFPDPTDPFSTSFPEIYTINGLTDDEVADFVGVKVGDVNCSAVPNDVAGSSDDRNADGDLIFTLADQSLKAGETYQLDFQAQDFDQVQGFQFTMSFNADAIEFNEAKAGELINIGDANFGFHKLNEGIITASWNTLKGAQSIDNGKALFSFSFTALEDGQLSDWISLNSRFTRAEGYDINGKLDLSLQFVDESGIAEAQFELFQNQPNPFKDETVVGFNLPESGKATFKVFDISGRVIKMVEGDYSKGYNEISINRSDLHSSGVLYYQLESAEYIASKKMVLLD